MKVKILEISERVLAITAFVMVASVASSYGQGFTPDNIEVTGHLGGRQWNRFSRFFRGKRRRPCFQKLYCVGRPLLYSHGRRQCDGRGFNDERGCQSLQF
jgi:hypothetical protein